MDSTNFVLSLPRYQKDETLPCFYDRSYTGIKYWTGVEVRRDYEHDFFFYHTQTVSSLPSTFHLRLPGPSSDYIIRFPFYYRRTWSYSRHLLHYSPTLDLHKGSFGSYTKIYTPYSFFSAPITVSN